MGRVALCVALLASLVGVALAAVHPYNTAYFYAVNDAFIFRGGREGLFKSQSEVWHLICAILCTGVHI